MHPWAPADTKCMQIVCRPDTVFDKLFLGSTVLFTILIILSAAVISDCIFLMVCNRGGHIKQLWDKSAMAWRLVPSTGVFTYQFMISSIFIAIDIQIPLNCIRDLFRRLLKITSIYNSIYWPSKIRLWHRRSYKRTITNISCMKWHKLTTNTMRLRWKLSFLDNYSYL